jgi:LacI family transcriptional regulator
MVRPKQQHNIYKIAEEAGVSISAVSCVLNNRPGVGEKTRKRIATIIDRYGYTRNYRKTEGRTIGLVLPEILEDLYMTAIINGVMGYAAESNVDIATILYPPGYPKDLPLLLREHCCDAALFVLPDRIMDEISFLAEIKLPFILMDAKLENDGRDTSAQIGYVDNDSYQGSYDLTRYLIGLGHSRIAFVAWEKHNRAQNGLSRIRGWRDAMLETGVSEGELDQNLFYIKNVIDDVGALPLNTFTALMANDDTLAMGCLSVCYDLGIRVPDDLSVTGFGNLEMTRFFAPPLTTVDQKAFKVGYEAARHAGELAMGKIDTVPRIVLPTEIVIRSSTGPAERK